MGEVTFVTTSGGVISLRQMHTHLLFASLFVVGTGEWERCVSTEAAVKCNI